MECPICDSEKIQLVSNTYSNHDTSLFGIILILIATVVIAISFASWVEEPTSNQNLNELIEIAEYIATKNIRFQMMVFGINTFILGMAFAVFKPPKTKTAVNGVCTECGNIWLIGKCQNPPSDEW